jgi:hypothetical protein
MKRELYVVIALVIVSVILVSSVRRELWETHRRVQETSDVYFLPAPQQLAVLSMGYRHTLADILWAHVMVSQGYHTFQKRRFGNLGLLYDAINTLDPEWRKPYLMADALFTFQAETTPFEEVVKVREILELGVKNRPFDAEMWLVLGSFVAYGAPSTHLLDRPDIAAVWRREGLRYLARAAELCGGDSNICWQALAGASGLAHDGEREAAIGFLQRTYAVTDDEELKKDILRRLQRLMAERDLDSYKKRDESFQALAKSELPFLTRDETLILGPPQTPERCAGAGHDDDPKCAPSWHEWSERYSNTSP